MGQRLYPSVPRPAVRVPVKCRIGACVQFMPACGRSVAFLAPSVSEPCLSSIGVSCCVSARCLQGQPWVRAGPRLRVWDSGEWRPRQPSFCQRRAIHRHLGRAQGRACRRKAPVSAPLRLPRVCPTLHVDRPCVTPKTLSTSLLRIR